MSVTALLTCAVILGASTLLLVAIAIKTAPLMPDDYDMPPWDDDYDMAPWDKEGYWDE